VVVKGLVFPEDLLDDDEYVEICGDITDMVTSCGSGGPRPRSIIVPQSGENVGTVSVVLGSAEDAKAVAAGLHHKVVGGKALEVE
ncbi:unnamed protein product, partial [Discosporangium mesarthrocarpum]